MQGERERGNEREGGGEREREREREREGGRKKQSAWVYVRSKQQAHARGKCRAHALSEIQASQRNIRADSLPLNLVINLNKAHLTEEC